jgi:NAD(P)-dependent dehydrogenase (short-subunit alcohol dehydrogenase family)
LTRLRREASIVATLLEEIRMQEFRSKVAVVTGGASGIGLAMAERFAREGMKLVLADVEKEPLDAVTARFQKDGVEVLAVETDVSDAERMDALGKATLDAFGAAHIVCNNAGVAAGGRSWELSTADWKWVIDVNLWGVIHGIRVFAPGLIAQGEGHIVNIASVAGLLSVPGLGPYSVSKHGVVTLSETLYGELVAIDSKVRVSVVCPSWVKTGIFDADRNRPSAVSNPETEEGTAHLEQYKQLGALLLANAMSASDVADRVFEAVVEERFYVLTHEEVTPAVQLRLANIVEGRNPEPLLFPDGMPSFIDPVS